MQTKKTKGQLVLKKWVRILLIIVLSFFALLSLYKISDGLTTKENKTPYYSYKAYRNIDYKVYLKENDFFEEEYLEKGKQYTTDLIDYIDIDFNYLFSGSKLMDLNYKYNINAQIIGEYESNDDAKSEIWNKKYTLLEPQTINKENTMYFDLKQNLKLDYSKYNDIANNFRNKFKLAIDAKLVIKLNVIYDGVIKNSNQHVKGVDDIEISIPLSRTTMIITTNYKDKEFKNLYSDELKPKNMEQVYIYSILLIITIIVFISNKNKLILNKKSYYLKTYNKILKNYSDIIVEVSSPVNFENLEIFKIKNFDDMVDTEEELKSPILLYEKDKDKESWFIIVHDKYAYIYILTCEEK